MIGWHHQRNGHELEQTLGDGEGPGSLACYSPWGHKESDLPTKQQKNMQILLITSSSDLQVAWVSMIILIFSLIFLRAISS